MDMDNKVKIVKFENFVFSPNFNLGQRQGVFYLVAFDPEREIFIITSNIIDILDVDGVIIVETQNTIYQLEGRIPRLENIKRYLKDEKYTSSEFFDNCVPNKMPTSRGWQVF